MERKPCVFLASLILVVSAAIATAQTKQPPKSSTEQQKPTAKTWGHDTFMCGLDFLNLDLRYYPHGLPAKLVLLVYFDSNHSNNRGQPPLRAFPQGDTF